MNRSFYRNFYAAETFLSVPFFGWLPKKGTYYNIVSYFGTPKNRKTNKYIADYLWINFSDEKTEENKTNEAARTGQPRLNRKNIF
jgi:hypothetical protein